MGRKVDQFNLRSKSINRENLQSCDIQRLSQENIQYQNQKLINSKAFNRSHKKGFTNLIVKIEKSRIFIKK